MKRFVVVAMILAASFGLGPALLASQDDPCREVYKLYLDACGAGFFSRANEGIFYSYLDWGVFKENKFREACDLYDDKKPMKYLAFKLTVCNKQTIKYPVFKKSAVFEKGETIQKNTDKIKTRFGILTLGETDIEHYDLTIFLNGLKIFTLKDCCSASSFDERSFKVGSSNIYFISAAMGNAAEWSNLVIENSDGLFIYEESINPAEFLRVTVNGGKMIMKEPTKYDKDIIMTYDNGKLTRMGNFDSATKKVIWNTKELKLTKIY
jgi:hypothetical protein